LTDFSPTTYVLQTNIDGADKAGMTGFLLEANHTKLEVTENALPPREEILWREVQAMVEPLEYSTVLMGFVGKQIDRVSAQLAGIRSTLPRPSKPPCCRVERGPEKKQPGRGIGRGHGRF
jgi:hypothetical protein